MNPPQVRAQPHSRPVKRPHRAHYPATPPTQPTGHPTNRLKAHPRNGDIQRPPSGAPCPR
jgi:hypothetical protein